MKPLQITFTLRHASRGLSYIVARIYLNGQRTYPFTTGYKIENEFWDSRAQRPRPGKAPDVAQGLDLLKTRYMDIYAKFKPKTAEQFKEAILTPESKPFTLLELLQQYYSYQEEQFSAFAIKKVTLIDHKRKAETLRGYLKRLALLHMPGQEFSHLHAKKLEKSVRECVRSIAYGSKILGHMKAVLSYALACHYVTSNGMEHIKLPAPPPRPVALSQKNVQTLERLKLSGTSEGVRNLFLLQLATGLNFVDVYQLPGATLENVNGLNFARIERAKSKLNALPYSQIVYISPHVEMLLQKGVFKITNQKANSHLKILAEAANIPYELCSKHARSSFAQAMYDRLPREIVQALLGHTSSSTLEKHYANVSMSRIALELRRAGLAK